MISIAYKKDKAVVPPSPSISTVRVFFIFKMTMAMTTSTTKKKAMMMMMILIIENVI